MKFLKVHHYMPSVIIGPLTKIVASQYLHASSAIEARTFSKNLIWYMYVSNRREVKTSYVLKLNLISCTTLLTWHPRNKSKGILTNCNVNKDHLKTESFNAFSHVEIKLFILHPDWFSNYQINYG